MSQRYVQYMNSLVAGAQVNGMDAMFAIIVANERVGEKRLEALREAKADIAKVIFDLDYAIAHEELALTEKPPRATAVTTTSNDLANVIFDIARAGAAPYLPRKP